jgi:hypothetical protein
LVENTNFHAVSLLAVYLFDFADFTAHITNSAEFVEKWMKMSAERLAELLSLSHVTVRRLCKIGKIPTAYKDFGRWYVADMVQAAACLRRGRTKRERPQKVLYIMGGPTLVRIGVHVNPQGLAARLRMPLLGVSRAMRLNDVEERFARLRMGNGWYRVNRELADFLAYNADLERA